MTNYNEYKQQIIDFYDGRNDYDNDFTRTRAVNLLELVDLQPKQTILDVATGTGFIAISAAEKVGNTAKIIGVDFASKMLARARAKIEALKLNNIELLEEDVDRLNFADRSFDAIFCSSAIVLFTDPRSAILSWYNWLKPKGTVAFSVYFQESFFTPVILQVCTQLGYDLPNLHNTFGTPAKSKKILQEIGFKQIEVKIKEMGKYLSLEEAQNWWKGDWLHPQYHPLLKLDSVQREELKAKFRQEISKLSTAKGVWYESTIFFVTGKK